MTRETERTLRMIRRCGLHQQGEPAYVGTGPGEAVLTDAPIVPLVRDEALFPVAPLPDRSDWGES